ncbi:MAG: TolC family protein [Myxococcota bacterium]
MSSVLGLVAAVQLAGAPITLDEVRQASRQQLDALRAELDVERAGWDRTSARSSILPQLRLTLGAGVFYQGPFNYVNPDGTVAAQPGPETTRGNFSLNLSLSQLLYDGGRWWNQIAQAGHQEEATKGQLEEQRLASELEATRRFFNLLNAQVQLKTLEETVKRSREQVERARGLYDAGRSPRSAWLDAQVNLGNDEIALLRQRQNIVSLRTQLLQWLGRPDADVEAQVPPALDFRTAPPAYDVALAQARRRRPLFHALDERLRAQGLAISVASADYWPRVSVNGTYGHAAPSAEFFFSDWGLQNSLSAGFNLSWDLFNGLAHKANVERARVELTRAEREQVQAVVDLETELRRTLNTLETELEVLKISEKNLELAQQQEKLETERFSAGANTSLDVRNAQIKLTQAQLAVVQGKANVAVARAALYRVVGGDLEGTP